MPNLEYRLVKHFSKPEPGEYVPIIFIEMTKETVAWSPKLNQSIYVTPDMPGVDGLKRMREVNVLKVINKLSCRISTIELTEGEKEQFEGVYITYMEQGGQILFSRKKVGSKMVSFFELLDDAAKKNEVEIESTLLSKKLEGE
jgi:hypothetical protein